MKLSNLTFFSGAILLSSTHSLLSTNALLQANCLPDVCKGNQLSDLRSRLLRNHANNDYFRTCLTSIIKLEKLAQAHEQETPRTRQTACRTFQKHILNLLRSDSPGTGSFLRKCSSDVALHGVSLSVAQLKQRSWRVLELLNRKCNLPLRNAGNSRHRKIAKRAFLEPLDDEENSDDDEDEDDEDEDEDASDERADNTNSTELSFQQKADNALPDMQQPVYLIVGCISAMVVLCLFVYLHRRGRQQTKKASGIDSAPSNSHGSAAPARESTKKHDDMDSAGSEKGCGTQINSLQEDDYGKRAVQQKLDDADAITISVTGVATFTEEPLVLECGFSQEEKFRPLPQPSSPYLEQIDSLAVGGIQSLLNPASVPSDGRHSSSTTVVASSSPSSSACSISSSDEHQPSTTDDICTKIADTGNPLLLAVHEIQTLEEPVSVEPLGDLPQVDVMLPSDKHQPSITDDACTKTAGTGNVPKHAINEIRTAEEPVHVETLCEDLAVNDIETAEESANVETLCENLAVKETQTAEDSVNFQSLCENHALNETQIAEGSVNVETLCENLALNETQTTEESLNVETLCDSPRMENESLDPSAQKRSDHEQTGLVDELCETDISAQHGKDSKDVRISANTATICAEEEPGPFYTNVEGARSSTVLDPSHHSSCIPVPVLPLEISEKGLSSEPSSLKSPTHAFTLDSPRLTGPSSSFQIQKLEQRSCPNSRRTSMSCKNDSDDSDRQIARNHSTGAYDPMRPPFQYPTPNYLPPQSPTSFWGNDTILRSRPRNQSFSSGSIQELSAHRTARSADRRTSIAQIDRNQWATSHGSPSPMYGGFPDPVPAKYRNLPPINTRWNPERPLHPGDRSSRRLSIYPFSSPSSRVTTPTEVKPHLGNEKDGSVKPTLPSLDTLSHAYGSHRMPCRSGTDTRMNEGMGCDSADTNMKIRDENSDVHDCEVFDDQNYSSREVTRDDEKVETEIKETAVEEKVAERTTWEREEQKKRGLRASMFRDIFFDEC